MFQLRCQGFAAIACVTFVMDCCQSAKATVLTFDMTTHPGFVSGGFETTYATYGDNVTATTAAGPGVTYSYGMGNGFTPNITVSYSHLDNAPAGSGGNSLYPAGGSWADPINYLHHQVGDIFWMTFTPTSLFGVDVNSFAIDLFNGSGTLNWKLRQGSTVGPIFASGTELALLASDPDRIVTIPNGIYSGIVVIEFDFTGSSGNIGIDDLNFDQVLIPEPSSLSLLGLGLIGLTVKSRRRRAAARATVCTPGN